MRDVQVSVPASSVLPAEETLTSGEKESLILATFADGTEQLRHAIFLAESVRTFAGRYRHCPIWVFVPRGDAGCSEELRAQLREQRVELHESAAPAEAVWFYYARKVFAAAQAEAETEGQGRILVWLDEDTIVLQEPKAFILDPNRSLAYRPVMHRNIGSLYSEPPDAFWVRIYERLTINEEAIFPMVTPADGDTIRPYFNAGLLVVRPERGILRRWAEDFTVLFSDTVLISMSRQDEYKRIFLHQTALVGAILNVLSREEMLELSRQYNYPLFFKEMYGAAEKFDSLEGVVTLRYDVYFRHPAPDWREWLKGPPEKVKWLGERLGKSSVRHQPPGYSK